MAFLLLAICPRESLGEVFYVRPDIPPSSSSKLSMLFLKWPIPVGTGLRLMAAERQPEERDHRPCDDEGGSAIGAPCRSAPASEMEVVAGRGASSTMEFQPQRVPIRRGVSALRHRDFRLFWSTQILSLVGTWMQIVAQSWLVLELTNSPFILGIVSALQFLPTLVFSLPGGVVADRLPRRRILLATQTSAMLLAFVLGFLTQTGIVQIAYVMVLAFLLGVVNSVDMPTRQAFVVELVGGEDLRNAIALNSAAFNSARLIGPAVAGLAIGWVGLAGAFYINGVSFLGVIAALWAIRAGRRPVSRGVEAGSVWEDLREGLAYVAHTPVIWLVVLLVGLVGTFGMNLNVLIPVYARDLLQVGAQGYGLLTSAMGVGSLVAALILAFRGLAPRRGLVIGSAVALGALQMVMIVVQQFVVALVLLAAIGFAMIFFTTLSNTTLQTATPDRLRGRVMSVYTTVFAGTTPLGSLFAGGIAERWGVGISFFIGGVVSVASVGAGYLLGRRARGSGRSGQ